MEKTIFEQMNGTYEQQGDYFIPCLAATAEEEKPIGIWGQRHLRYLKQNRKVLYYNLLTSEKLNEYIAEIDKQAENMFFRLVKQMSECENVTERFKSTDQMLWVKKMNNIRNRATEIINKKIIYSV